MSQWQPRYDPAAHRRRIDDGVPPQGYGQQGYQQPPQFPPPQFRPPQRRRRSGGRVIFGVLCGLAVLIFIAITAARGGSLRPSPAASGPAASIPVATQAASPAGASTVTFVTTGSPAQVTFGPEGSSFAGTVPMHQVEPLGNPIYYSLTAQLNGSGEVTCKILVGSTVVAQAVATGGYNIAMCEISRDPLTGQWSDTSAG